MRNLNTGWQRIILEIPTISLRLLADSGKAASNTLKQISILIPLVAGWKMD
jgi:hypothetical protein